VAERAGSKRFVHPDRLPEFKLTSRVLALLAYAAKHRLISSDDLALLDGGSRQNVKRELRTLWVNRFCCGRRAVEHGRHAPLPADATIERRGA
jgi:hypothetical protein